MPSRPCLVPGCPNLATYRGRCQEHARKRDRSIPRAGKTVYSTKKWRTTRRAKLTETPICETEGCARLATDVHHRVDLADGGDPYRMGNLEAHCHAHHSSETRRRQVAA